MAQTNIIYDCDSSLKAWSHYKQVYNETHWPLLKEFQQSFLITRTKKVTRLLRNINPESTMASKEILNVHFKIGGDCDFNFNDRKKRIYEKILEQSSAAQATSDLLNECCKKHHSLPNFSIMAVSGSMNNVKNSLYVNSVGNITIIAPNNHIHPQLDRLDTFVYSLHAYYQKQSDAILKFSRMNRRPLEQYLHLFEDVYEYCRIIYFIEDTSFVNRLIEEGKQPMETEGDVIRYMKLANEFWEKKQDYWKKHFDYIIEKDNFS